jgi:hypothetical protein
MPHHAELGLESAETYEAALRRLDADLRAAERSGDLAATGTALLDLGRVYEKLGRFNDARKAGGRALATFEECGDESGVAQCCHTLAVWFFHHGREHESFPLFVRAAETREALDELLLAAQSWHNLGYVQCRVDRAGEAFTSYARAQILLDRVAAGTGDMAAKADRNRAFIWSHMAFATAVYSDPREALNIAVRYFELVAATGAHREPLLAFTAVPVAFDRDTSAQAVDAADRLRTLTGLRADPEVWFGAALDRGLTAFGQHRPGTGRRPYLGAMLLVLSEYGRWCLAAGREENGQALLARALELAEARGWPGEVRRIGRMALPS